MRKLMLSLIMLALSIGIAEAKSHHKHPLRHSAGVSYAHHHKYRHGRYAKYARYDSGSIVAHPAGCPRVAFCGCGASVKIFGHPVRSLYLAANWFQFPRARAAPGMAAVRRHHVFVILAVNGNGTVRAYDANSGGHLTRIHTISLTGYAVVDPHATRRRYATAE